jgi:hypothetical protein
MNINNSLERLDPIFMEKIHSIQEKTQQDIKEILETAIDLYYEQIKQVKNDPLAVLKQSKFIGCGESNPDLSSTYKTEFKTILEDSL